MNHYEVLGVSKNASQQEIKNSYKSLVKKYHPDIYPGDKTFAEIKIKQINNAYEVLSNLEAKSKYDKSIKPTPIYSYTVANYSKNYSYTINNQAKSNKKNFEKAITKSFDKLSHNNKLKLITLVLFIYIILFVFTIKQANVIINNPKNTITNNYTESPQNTSTTYEDFNINMYFSDDDLRQIYNQNYKNNYSSFEEFKEDFSKFIYYNYDV